MVDDGFSLHDCINMIVLPLEIIHVICPLKLTVKCATNL